MKLNVLLIGSGGREHALAWKFSQSVMCGEFYCAPSNAGIKKIAKSAKINVKNHQEVINFCINEKIDFVIVGPEDPLAQGIVDDLERCGILTFGPLKAAAMLESSKDFSKQICVENNIPTANIKLLITQMKLRNILKNKVLRL
jgi:phosphoribosylamine--glycine ligase